MQCRLPTDSTQKAAKSWSMHRACDGQGLRGLWQQQGARRGPLKRSQLCGWCCGGLLSTYCSAAAVQADGIRPRGAQGFAGDQWRDAGIKVMLECSNLLNIAVIPDLNIMSCGTHGMTRMRLKRLWLSPDLGKTTLRHGGLQIRVRPMSFHACSTRLRP